MTKCIIDILRIPGTEDLPLPEYATQGSAGMDIYAANDKDIILKPFQRCLVPTGLKVGLPRCYEMQIRPRSGLALKNGITVLNSPGTIDSDFRGEIKVLLVNLGDEDFLIERGMRIAQAIIAKHEIAILNPTLNLTDSTRGEGGFGHSGLK